MQRTGMLRKAVLAAALSLTVGSAALADVFVDGHYRSDGTYVRDYIYVADVVDAYLAVAEALKRPDVNGEAFNFASGAQVSVLEMVKSIAKLVGGRLPEPRVLNIAKNEIKEQRLSTEKAKRILEWKPRVSLDDGLRSTIEWYRSYLGAKP